MVDQKPKFIDRYAWTARVTPMLVTVSPILMAVGAFVPSLLSGVNVAWPVGASAVAYVLLEHFGRKPGRELQQLLFSMWGGAPTTQILRHQDPTFDELTLGRYHEKLAAAIDHPAPTYNDELTDRAAADRVYGSFTSYLREATRGWPLVEAESRSYGFRRNLWGLKKAGLPLALLGATACAAAAMLISPVPVAAWVGCALNCFLALFWWRWVTTDWVKSAAFIYAEQLIKSCEALPRPPEAP